MSDLAPVKENVAHDFAETERGERQVMPFQAQRRNADQQARHSGDDPSRDEARPKQKAGTVGRDQRGRVRADPEEGSMPERDLSGIAEHNIEADREQRID